MPKGGRRVGSGRKPGTPNKSTTKKIADAKIAEQIAAEIGQPAGAVALALQKLEEGRKLAKTELEEFLPIIKGTVGIFQRAAMKPDGTGVPGGAGYSREAWADFKAWAEFFVTLMDKLADFQSPKYKAIMVATPGAGDGAGAPAEGMRDITPAGDLDDDTTIAAQTYLRLVKG